MAKTAMYQTPRERCDLVQAQLEQDRSSFESHWQELSDFVAPRRALLNIENTNRGDKYNQNIIDSTATLALRTTRAGMMSGITSPARPWFKITLADQSLAEIGSVKRWLDDVGSRMATAFLRSNLYNALPIVYGDMALFGTGCMLIEEDLGGNAFRFKPFQIGSYAISQNGDLRVDTFFRKFKMTARQMVLKFGVKDPLKPTEIDWSVFSTAVREAYENNQKETWFEVCHLIEPNEDFRPAALESKYKRFSSKYYENGSDKNSQKKSDIFLRESGYDYFPILAPRWDINGEDIYGTSCPGMDALGDIKQLQMGEKRSLQAIEKIVNPPMIGPTSLKNAKVSLTPGDITYNDIREGMQGLRTVHDIRFSVNELEQKQQQVRSRIQRAFYEDLFLMLANSDRREITAREIDERHEEKLLALGPVLEQLNQDMLDPLIDICFFMMNKQGLLPQPPPEIQGSDLKIEYISVMAQAQKMVGLGSIDRFMGFVANVASYDQSVLDKVDVDQSVDVYADITSVPSSIVRTDEETQAIRDQKAKAQQQMQQAEMAKQSASAAKDLSQAKLQGGDTSALDALLGT